MHSSHVEGKAEEIIINKLFRVTVGGRQKAIENALEFSLQLSNSISHVCFPYFPCLHPMSSPQASTIFLPWIRLPDPSVIAQKSLDHLNGPAFQIVSPWPSLTLPLGLIARLGLRTTSLCQSLQTMAGNPTRTALLSCSSKRSKTEATSEKPSPSRVPQAVFLCCYAPLLEDPVSPSKLIDSVKRQQLVTRTCFTLQGPSTIATSADEQSVSSSFE